MYHRDINLELYYSGPKFLDIRTSMSTGRKFERHVFVEMKACTSLHYWHCVDRISNLIVYLTFSLSTIASRFKKRFVFF